MTHSNPLRNMRPIPLDQYTYNLQCCHVSGGDPDCSHEFPSEPETENETMGYWHCPLCNMQLSIEKYL